MSTYQNSNQFTQTPVLGQLSMVPNPSLMSVKIDPSSVATKLQAGQAVKIVDVQANEIIVDQAAITDTKFGVIVYNPKKNVYAAGDTVEIAINGSVVFLEASAAIARGAKVQLDPTGPTVATLASLGTNTMVGVCLDKPTGSGQLTRVLIRCEDPNLSAY